MNTILGAGGVISNELVKLLAARKQPFRLVGRHPCPQQGMTETISADLSDESRPFAVWQAPAPCTYSLA